MYILYKKHKEQIYFHYRKHHACTLHVFFNLPKNMFGSWISLCNFTLKDHVEFDDGMIHNSHFLLLASSLCSLWLHQICSSLCMLVKPYVKRNETNRSELTADDFYVVGSAMWIYNLHLLDWGKAREREEDAGRRREKSLFVSLLFVLFVCLADTRG